MRGFTPSTRLVRRTRSRRAAHSAARASAAAISSFSVIAADNGGDKCLLHPKALEMKTSMTRKSPTAAVVAMACCILLAGCTGTQPAVYPGLASSHDLTANLHDSGHLPFSYTAPNVALATYNAFLLDPIVIYQGPGNQFASTSENDKQAVANYMQQQFAKKLGGKLRKASAAGSSTLRIHVTLTRIEENTPVLSTVSKIVPAGLIFNTIQTARGKKGT